MSLPAERRPVVALVAAKGFDHAKSRLGRVLEPAERETLARAMLERVLGVLEEAGLDEVRVVTDGQDVARVARARGASVAADPEEATFAEVIDGSLAQLAGEGARTALVLMGDLPAVRPRDIEGLLSVAAEGDVVAAPDLRGTHTNALLMPLPAPFGTRFGDPRSFARHRDEAAAAGLTFAVHESLGLSLDLDEPADLLFWREWTRLGRPDAREVDLRPTR